jgi:hypothetical protein
LSVPVRIYGYVKTSFKGGDPASVLKFPFTLIKAVLFTVLELIHCVFFIWDYSNFWYCRDVALDYGPLPVLFLKALRRPLLESVPWTKHNEAFKQFVMNGTFEGDSINFSDIDDSLSQEDILMWHDIDFRMTKALLNVSNNDKVSFHLKYEWGNQNWGDCKGRVFIKAGDAAGEEWVAVGKTVDYEDYQGDKHKIEISDRPTIEKILRTKKLQFGYRVGGGGGHTLYIKRAEFKVKVEKRAQVEAMEMGVKVGEVEDLPLAVAEAVPFVVPFAVASAVAS